ncbi:zinc-finger domain-containing protein [Thiolapillus sp.]
MSAEAARKTRQREVRVSRDQQPLSCPLPEEEIWNLHPRVYLPIERTGEAVCPYCGTRYILSD